MPEQGQGQVVVRIEASGLCHNDIHQPTAAGRSDLPPFIPTTRASASWTRSARASPLDSWATGHGA
jgi:threonine dehydrogenase-like Zn-dependent dehydrogenase